MSKSGVIILSSPRKGSNSSALALAVGEGFTDAGGRVETIDLNHLDIKPCRGCEACQRNGGRCAQIDGMQEAYPHVIAADALVLATPVYWFNMSGQLKIFLDRCFAVAMTEAGHFSKKTLAAVLAYGDADPFVSGAVNALRSFQDTCNFTGATWGGCLYGSATDRDTLTKDTELLAEARELGRRLVTG